MHPATMEWLILQAAVTVVDRPLAEKSVSLKRLAEELAPDYHETIVNLHLKKMEARGLLCFQQDTTINGSEKVNESDVATVTFLAKIDAILDMAPTG